MGIDFLKHMYEDDVDFKEVYEVCRQFSNSCHSEFSEYLL